MVQRLTRRSAFTLVELMVVTSIIGILTALTAGGLSHINARAKRINCTNNLRQLGVVSHLYASDDRSGALSNTFNDGDDNQNWVYPVFISSRKTFKCPATRHLIRPTLTWTNDRTGMVELQDFANCASDNGTYGSSYEVFGFMNKPGNSVSQSLSWGVSTNVPGIRKTESTIQNYIHQSPDVGLYGSAPGPSRIWLFVDGDPAPGNFPNRRSNHGAAGLNVQCCDGHVEWITPRAWTMAYAWSQDEGGTIY